MPTKRSETKAANQAQTDNEWLIAQAPQRKMRVLPPAEALLCARA
jgi:hypothetical protein